ncbi:MAG: tetratricopeptide repeat protein [Flavobacteriales bacterium]
MLRGIFKKGRYLCAALAVFLCVSGRAQSFDKKALEKKLASFSKKQQVKFLDSVSNTYSQQDLASGTEFLNFCIDFAWKHKFENKNMAVYLYRRGSLFRKLGQYPKALADFSRAERIYFEEKDDAGLQSMYSAYAHLYSMIGENLKAIQYIKKALEKAELVNDMDAKAVSYNALAIIYRSQSLPDSALHFYRMALSIYQQNKANYQQALVLDNIAIIFMETNKLDSAYYYNQKAQEVAAPLKNTYLELQLLLNVCGICENKKDFAEQMKVSQRAKFLADSLQIPFYQLICDGNVAVAMKNVGKNREAIEIFKNVKPLLYEINDMTIMENFFGEMSIIFDNLNQPDSALFYFKLSAAYKDSIQNVAEKDRVDEIIARFSLEEKEKNIQNLQKQKSEEQEKGRLKSIIIWVAAGMMAVVLILLIIVIQRFKENRKLNSEITNKNLVLADKQKEILDSINYAKKIQYALLAHDDLLKANLPEHFVLFKPKDIVSGDFYWATAPTLNPSPQGGGTSSPAEKSF